jgi:hypothetical protein
VIDPNETFSNAKFVADSGVSPNKNLEDVLADDEDSNDSTSQGASQSVKAKLEKLEAKQLREKMNEAVGLFAKIDEEKLSK